MGYKIARKQTLAPKTVLFEVEAPQIARKAKAGQFIILRVQDQGERIPLTIAQADPGRGLVTLVVQELGKTTYDLNRLEAGQEILDFVGPLGKPTHILPNRRVCMVGGGVGNAVLWAQVRGFKEAGNHVIAIIGARSKDLLILEDEIGALADELHVTTDDGSYKRKGLVTDALKDVLRSGKIDEVITIGPVIMMKYVCMTTADFGVPTQASLNPIMVDGTGMCGACRVTVGGETKFACVDGPEFDGHKVDFDELMSRLSFYKELETAAYTRAREEGCRLMGQEVSRNV